MTSQEEYESYFGKLDEACCAVVSGEAGYCAVSPARAVAGMLGVSQAARVRLGYSGG